MMGMNLLRTRKQDRFDLFSSLDDGPPIHAKGKRSLRKTQLILEAEAKAHSILIPTPVNADRGPHGSETDHSKRRSLMTFGLIRRPTARSEACDLDVPFVYIDSQTQYQSDRLFSDHPEAESVPPRRTLTSTEETKKFESCVHHCQTSKLENSRSVESKAKVAGRIRDFRGSEHTQNRFSVIESRSAVISVKRSFLSSFISAKSTTSSRSPPPTRSFPKSSPTSASAASTDCGPSSSSPQHTQLPPTPTSPSFLATYLNYQPSLGIPPGFCCNLNRPDAKTGLNECGVPCPDPFECHGCCVGNCHGSGPWMGLEKIFRARCQTVPYAPPLPPPAPPAPSLGRIPMSEPEVRLGSRPSEWRPYVEPVSAPIGTSALANHSEPKTVPRSPPASPVRQFFESVKRITPSRRMSGFNPGSVTATNPSPAAARVSSITPAPKPLTNQRMGSRFQVTPVI